MRHFKNYICAKSSRPRVDDLAVDVYYYFDKSTKLEYLLSDYFNFCDLEYKKMPTCATATWLS